MTFKSLVSSDGPEVVRLFHDTFLDSEGESEAVAVSSLAGQLAALSDGPDVSGFGAWKEADLAGAIYFSRLTMDDDITAFLLAPVAVGTRFQGKGVGQTLIRSGLDALQEAGVDFVATYGDPAFYARVGFESVSHEVIRPPFPLSQPIGWLGQTLGERHLQEISGDVGCIAPFNDPALW